MLLDVWKMASEILDPPDVFPLDPIVNKSSNIECCCNKMHQTITTMIVSYYPFKKYVESESFFSVCCPSVMSLKPLFKWSQLQLSSKFTTVGI